MYGLPKLCDNGTDAAHRDTFLFLLRTQGGPAPLSPPCHASRPLPLAPLALPATPGDVVDPKIDGYIKNMVHALVEYSRKLKS